MTEQNQNIARQYYTLMNEKKLDAMEELLHPKVEFVGPLATLSGKKAVVRAINGFMRAFESLSIRHTFHEDDLVMLALDTQFPEPMGNLRTASLMTFKEGKISKIELFYDSQVIKRKREEIFAE